MGSASERREDQNLALTVLCVTHSLDSGARVEACICVHGFPSDSVSEELSPTDAKDAVGMVVGTRKAGLGNQEKTKRSSWSWGVLQVQGEG